MTSPVNFQYLHGSSKITIRKLKEILVKNVQLIFFIYLFILNQTYVFFFLTDVRVQSSLGTFRDRREILR